MFSAFVLMGLIIPFFANPAPTCPLGGHSKLLSILRTQKLVSSHIFGSNSIEDTTLQFMMNAKLSQLKFLHCQENGIVLKFPTIPKSMSEFQVGLSLQS